MESPAFAKEAAANQVGVLATSNNGKAIFAENAIVGRPRAGKHASGFVGERRLAPELRKRLVTHGSTSESRGSGQWN